MKNTITRSHPFKVITTRRFYTEEHSLSVIINDMEGEQ